MIFLHALHLKDNLVESLLKHISTSFIICVDRRINIKPMVRAVMLNCIFSTCSRSRALFSYLNRCVLSEHYTSHVRNKHHIILWIFPCPTFEFLVDSSVPRNTLN